MPCCHNSETQTQTKTTTHSPSPNHKHTHTRTHRHRHHHRRHCVAPSITSDASAPLKLQCVSVCIPHPEKRAKRGEDAMFTSDQAFGVFDGVGGWALQNIDAGEYSKTLSRHCETKLNELRKKKKTSFLDPHDVLRDAVSNTSVLGSSTALLAILNTQNESLNFCNVGDCLALVIRRNEGVIFRTEDQQHVFNMPYQLSYEIQDDINVADVRNVDLNEGDIIIAASDGLWDNVFEDDIVSVIQKWLNNNEEWEHRKKCKREKHAFAVRVSKKIVSTERQNIMTGIRALHALTFEIADKACIVAHDENAISPFTIKAVQEDLYAPGGKLDDISIMIAVVKRTCGSYHATFYSDCYHRGCKRRRECGGTDGDDGDNEKENRMEEEKEEGEDNGRGENVQRGGKSDGDRKL